MRNIPSESIFSTLLLTIKQAFAVNKIPLPWMKAFSAGICAGLPVLIGYLLGSLEYGLIAGLGGLTYLYVFNIPYAFRAKKLFFALIGLSIAMGLGTLFAPYPFVSAFVVALIGSIGTFLFGALRITGPAAIFFVLVFLMGTGMPVDPSLAPLRAGLVFLSGAFSWVIGMIGWFNNPHGPEKVAVKKVYAELAVLIESAGTEGFDGSKQKIKASLKSAEELLLSGYIPWRVSETFKRLVLLNEEANNMFLYVLENVGKLEGKLPNEIGATLRFISGIIDKNEQEILPSLEVPNNQLARLYEMVNEASMLLNDPLSNIHHREISISKSSLRVVLGGAFDKNSVVFLNTIRYGSVLFVAAIIAQSFDFNRSYWVTLSCAAVLSGATIMGTFHRAIQRSLGTIVGILTATAILYFQPDGYVIVIAIFLLTFLTELAIVLNYGIAALFITPNALLLAESTTKIHDISYFASARVFDVLIGCAIGLIGTLVMNRKSAASIVPHTMAKTIRSQQQFFLTLFSKESSLIKPEHSRELSKMQTNLTNLKIVYTTALGEISRDKARLDLLYPAIHSIEQLGYLLDTSAKYKDRPILPDSELSQMLLVFEMMAKSAEQELEFSKKSIPEIRGFNKIQTEVHRLQDSLYASGLKVK
ncbi:FUSC family protein [Paenisporosarcina indica]|uniref:FUSC family protein n=1 Tax=Paenisporosarcina indica TaxID=650093 RepID=UPI000AEE5FD9|nr:FUSC family protein [Paenisporosarcina indica]